MNYDNLKLMRLVRAEDGIITQEMLNKVIFCDLETLPIIWRGHDVWTFLVDDGSLMFKKIETACRPDFNLI
jgi:hypothetical protein